MSIGNKDVPYALKPGTKLNDKYEIRSVIGTGGTSVIYLAYVSANRGDIAIKECFPSDYCSRGDNQELVVGSRHAELVQDTMERFEKEAVLMQENSANSGIMKVYEVFHANNTVYYVMEYLEGCSLKEYIDAQGGVLDWEQTKTMLFPVFASLISLHRFNIWHRDISPDNIFVCKDDKIRIIDFGNAREGLSGASRMLDWAKEGYAPIEQYSDEYMQGTWTDVYSLAATLYRCLTGEAPKSVRKRGRNEAIKSPRERGAIIPIHVEDAIMKGLAYLPQERYQTVADFKSDIYLEEPTLPLTDRTIQSVEAPVTESHQNMVVKLIGLDGVYQNHKIPVMQPVIMGRRADLCGVVFPPTTPGVSGLHCRIIWDSNQDGCILKDLGSTYGTRLLNGAMIQKNMDYLIREGEGFIIGDDNVFAVSKEFE